MTIHFKYKKIERPNPHGTAYVPAVPVTLSGPKESVDVIGILDSGADFSAIPLDLAKVLGLDLTGKSENIGGVGGDCKAVKSKVTIKIENSHESYTYSIYVYVIDDLQDEFPVLIGRSGFFNKFKITFDEKNLSVSLKKV